jgi:hypothetical protein
MTATNIDAGSVAALLLSLAVALYLPAIVRWWSRYFTLRRLPTPAAHSLITGHAGSYNFFAKHKYAQETSKKLGNMWRRREFWRQVR